jgi:hypothetical protein
VPQCWCHGVGEIAKSLGVLWWLTDEQLVVGRMRVAEGWHFGLRCGGAGSWLREQEERPASSLHSVLRKMRALSTVALLECLGRPVPAASY